MRFGVVLVLGGCAALGPPSPAPGQIAVGPPARPDATLPVLSAPGGQPAGALDTTTAAEKAAALAPAAAGAQALGTVAVSLGSPAEPGFWLRSALVTVAGPGRVELAGGQSVAVDLIPGEGAAQLSLAAFRALGLGLTDLPEVTVFVR